MLAPVLTFKRNDPVSQSMHEVTYRKGNKETRKEHALSFLKCGIVSKILGNSSTSQKEERIGSDRPSRVYCLLKGRRRNFYLLNSKRNNRKRRRLQNAFPPCLWISNIFLNSSYVTLYNAKNWPCITSDSCWRGWANTFRCAMYNKSLFDSNTSGENMNLLIPPAMG